jgi:putative transposase
VNRQAVFFCDRDYRIYLEALLIANKSGNCRIHAYALMTNHVHLLVTPDSATAIPRLMQAMGRLYVQKVNRIHGRTGTLWEGRYRASLVQDDEYLLTCQRYIELNPVRAGLAASPAAYPYSSYCANVMDVFNPLISAHPVYLSLGSGRRMRQAAYRRLFEAQLSETTLQLIRESTNACLVIGDDGFKDRVERALSRSVRHGKPGRPAKLRSDPDSGKCRSDPN